jgi:hypothetical protein
MFFVSSLVAHAPVTLDLAAWNFGTSLLALLVVAGLSV